MTGQHRAAKGCVPPARLVGAGRRDGPHWRRSRRGSDQRGRPLRGRRRPPGRFRAPGELRPMCRREPADDDQHDRAWARPRSARTQLRLQKLARKLSPPRRDGTIRQGASVQGWVKVLQREVDQPYRLVGADTLNQAVKGGGARHRADRCAGRVARVARPSRMGDERLRGDEGPERRGKVRSVTIYDPLYPYGDDFWGPSPGPGVRSRSGSWPPVRAAPDE